MVKLYHYTNYDGLQKIKREKAIRVSRGGSSSRRDMIHGPGVYLTALDPNQNTKEEIATNNWAGGGQSRLEKGYTVYYVEVEIPDSDYRLEECQDQYDKWVYRAGDYLDLDQFQWTSGKNTDWKDDLLAGAGIVGGIGLLAGLVMGGAALYNKHCKEEEEKQKRKH